jgi:hypothetical protein
MGPPKHHTPSGFWKDPRKLLTHQDGESPSLLIKHATTTHKKTKRNEFFELFIFFLPKATHFLFFSILTKISLTSSTLKEWEGSVIWNVKAYFKRVLTKILGLKWTSGSSK